MNIYIHQEKSDSSKMNKKLSYRRETRETLCIIWNVVLLLYE